MKYIEGKSGRIVLAKLEKDEEYFSENREMLLGLSADALEFLIQELVAFSTKLKEKEEEGDELDEEGNPIPNITSASTKKLKASELAEELKKNL